MVHLVMQKRGVIHKARFGQTRLTSKPLPNEPLHVAFGQPAWLERAESVLHSVVGAVRSLMSFLMPIIIVGGLAGHDYVLAGAYTIAGCRIKANISKYSGKKIFHVPGQEYYGPTVINHLKGERWFCTEAEARKAGWRKAGR